MSLIFALILTFQAWLLCWASIYFYVSAKGKNRFIVPAIVFIINILVVWFELDVMGVRFWNG
jgi:hypothetical protein